MTTIDGMDLVERGNDPMGAGEPVTTSLPFVRLAYHKSLYDIGGHRGILAGHGDTPSTQYCSEEVQKSTVTPQGLVV